MKNLNSAVHRLKKIEIIDNSYVKYVFFWDHNISFKEN